MALILRCGRNASDSITRRVYPRLRRVAPRAAPRIRRPCRVAKLRYANCHRRMDRPIRIRFAWKLCPRSPLLRPQLRIPAISHPFPGKTSLFLASGIVRESVIRLIPFHAAHLRAIYDRFARSVSVDLLKNLAKNFTRVLVCCCATNGREEILYRESIITVYFFLFCYRRDTTFFDAQNRFLRWRAQQFFVSSLFKWRPHKRWKNSVCISVVAVMVRWIFAFTSWVDLGLPNRRHSNFLLFLALILMLLSICRIARN